MYSMFITCNLPVKPDSGGINIDLNSMLIHHPASTVFLTVDNNLYMSMGIFNGDLLIVDRAKKITESSLVVYEWEGDFLLGRVFNIQRRCNFPLNPDVRFINKKGDESYLEFADDGVTIVGSITHVIHTVKEK